jgi:hypothetical protein
MLLLPMNPARAYVNRRRIDTTGFISVRCPLNDGAASRLPDPRQLQRYEIRCNRDTRGKQHRVFGRNFCVSAGPLRPRLGNHPVTIDIAEAEAIISVVVKRAYAEALRLQQVGGPYSKEQQTRANPAIPDRDARIIQGNECAASHLRGKLPRSLLKPLLGTGPAMRTTGPTTGAAFACLEFFNRALNPSAARRGLLGRDDPTNPFVPRQRRQVFPSRLRPGLQRESFTKICRSLMHRTWFAQRKFALAPA